MCSSRAVESEDSTCSSRISTQSTRCTWGALAIMICVTFGPENRSGLNSRNAATSTISRKMKNLPVTLLLRIAHAPFVYIIGDKPIQRQNTMI